MTPHGGNNMIRGSAPSDFDENWFNISYRLRGGGIIYGNLQFDWWFYDPLGAGGSNFRDFMALGFYNLAPTTEDYPGTGSLNSRKEKKDDVSERAIYVAEGTIDIACDTFESGRLLVFRPGDEITVTAVAPSRLLFLGGEPPPSHLCRVPLLEDRPPAGLVRVKLAWNNQCNNPHAISSRMGSAPSTPTNF